MGWAVELIFFPYSWKACSHTHFLLQLVDNLALCLDVLSLNFEYLLVFTLLLLKPRYLQIDTHKYKNYSGRFAQGREKWGEWVSEWVRERESEWWVWVCVCAVICPPANFQICTNSTITVKRFLVERTSFPRWLVKASHISIFCMNILWIYFWNTTLKNDKICIFSKSSHPKRALLWQPSPAPWLSLHPAVSSVCWPQPCAGTWSSEARHSAGWCENQPLS